MTAGWELRPAADRAVTRAPGIRSHHSFAFGDHYDPANLGFGPLLAYNDDVLEPGAGYPMHGHAGIEIVTWVVDGQLAHADSLGRRGLLGPGQAQRIAAGTGIRHAEGATAGAGVRFVQMWVQPDGGGGAPCSEAAPSVDCSSGRWCLLASGAGDGLLGLGREGARLAVARLRPDARLTAPPAGLRHLSVVRGAVRLTKATWEADVREGDTVRLRHPDPVHVVARGPSELLLWSFD